MSFLLAFGLGACAGLGIGFIYARRLRRELEEIVGLLR